MSSRKRTTLHCMAAVVASQVTAATTPIHRGPGVRGITPPSQEALAEASPAAR